MSLSTCRNNWLTTAVLLWTDCGRLFCSTKQWTQEFADSIDFKTDPVVCTPDVTEIQLKEDDEFVIVASDGLWWALSLHAHLCMFISTENHYASCIWCMPLLVDCCFMFLRQGQWVELLYTMHNPVPPVCSQLCVPTNTKGQWVELLHTMHNPVSHACSQLIAALGHDGVSKASLLCLMT